MFRADGSLTPPSESGPPFWLTQLLTKSFEPVPSPPLSDLLKTSFEPLPEVPSLKELLPVFTEPAMPRSPLSDLLKTSVEPMLPSSPLSDLLKTSFEPLPEVPSLKELLPVFTEPAMPRSSLSDLLKTSVEPMLPSSPLSDLLKTSFETLPKVPSLKELLPVFTEPAMPRLPLSDLSKISVNPVLQPPLLSDLLKTTFETPVTLPNLLSSAHTPAQASLQFSAFDPTALGPFAPLNDMLTMPRDSLRSLLNVIDSTIRPGQQAEISGLTALTGAMVSDWANTVGPVNPFKIRPFLRDFQETSACYSKFLASVPPAGFDPVYLPLPARGYFTSADALLEVDQGPGFDLELRGKREATRKNLETYTRASLEAALAKINPSLCKLWHGANLAAVSDNPDKVRHALTSLRELFTQVIHFLAPDADVKRWTTDPIRYHQGRPTREARLLFICSNVATPPLSDFVKAEVRSVLSLARVFQQGTHDINLSLSPAQLRLIFLRVESALCALIEASPSAL